MLIDRQLTEAGWSVQDKQVAQPVRGAGRRASARQRWQAGHGRADYLLYVDQTVVGVIEAKPEGTPLSGVEWQSRDVRRGAPGGRQARGPDQGRPAAVRLRGQRHRDPLHQRLRPRPAGPADLQLPQGGHPRQDPASSKDEEHPTWRGKVRAMPPLDDHAPAAGADRGDQRRRDRACASSATTAASCRWPPAPARPTPP